MTVEDVLVWLRGLDDPRVGELVLRLERFSPGTKVAVTGNDPATVLDLDANPSKIRMVSGKVVLG